MYSLVAMSQNIERTQKISPYLEALMRTESLNTARRASNMQLPTIEVLAKFAEDADVQNLVEKYGFKVRNRVGKVFVLRIPLTRISEMAGDDKVLRLEAERLPHPMMDLVPGQIGVDKVHDGTAYHLPQAFTGKDVVVGIVDAGFDYIHPFFRDSEGNTRIKWAADYMIDKKYVSISEVTAAMHSSDAETMYHGTHVAGIAAGSKVKDSDWDENTSKMYQGIATEADIAEAAVNSEITGTGLSSASSISAFADIFDYADEQGKPCVINYSMGDAMSFANSRQLEEEAIHTLLDKPGHVLVVASGNAGSTRRLAHKPADMGEGGCGVFFNNYEQYGTYFGIELKVKLEQTVTLRLTDTSYNITRGEWTQNVDGLLSATTLPLGSKIIQVQQKGQTADGYCVIYLTAGLTTQFATTDRIQVTIAGKDDAWVYADPLCAQLENIASIAGHQLAEDGYSMAWPAMLPEVVAVGNIAHRFQILTLGSKYSGQGPIDLTEDECTKGEGFLAKSSSVGPTLSGAIKPDVCAPGVNVVSAQSFFINDDTYYALAGWDIAALDTEYESWGGLSGYFHVMAQTGTSMSAPAVTGTIALWLQADPTLSTSRIKDVIAHSSRQPDSGLSYPNNLYGYGEIDAYRGLLYMLNLDGVIGLSQHQPIGAHFQLNGRHLSVDFDKVFDGTVTLRIFGTDGRLLMTSHDRSVMLDRLPHGVYAVQLTTSDAVTTGSTLIRL